MKAEVLLEIPEHIAGKLATGAYERVGGVVRDHATGKVVMWLREASPSPVDSRSLPVNPINNLLGVAGHAASILNLGATVAFGTATLAKLSKMDKKLDELSHRVQQLQWTVELGFANTLAALNDLSQHLEIELVGEMKSAAKLAWSCQFLEPGSIQRNQRIENALYAAINVKEKLHLHATQEMQRASEVFRNRLTGNGFNGFGFDDSLINALIRLRQAIAASSLCASISAEADDMYSASLMLVQDHKLLRALLQEMVATSLEPKPEVCGILMSSSYADFMPTSRIDALVRKYGEGNGGLFELLDISRRSDRFAGFIFFKEKDLARKAKARAFFDLVEGIDLDLDRLLGYQVEYSTGNERGLKVQEYRELFKLDDISGDNPLVYLSLNTSI